MEDNLTIVGYTTEPIIVEINVVTEFTVNGYSDDAIGLFVNISKIIQSNESELHSARAISFLAKRIKFCLDENNIH